MTQVGMRVQREGAAGVVGAFRDPSRPALIAAPKRGLGSSPARGPPGRPAGRYAAPMARPIESRELPRMADFDHRSRFGAMKGWIAVFTIPLVALLGAGAIGFAIGNSNAGGSGGPAPPATTTSASVDPHVAAGGHDFVQFACAQCHGALGQGGVSPAVPALTTVGATLTPAQLRKIIDKGLGVVATPTRPTCRCGARSSRASRSATS